MPSPGLERDAFAAVCASRPGRALPVGPRPRLRARTRARARRSRRTRRARRRLRRPAPAGRRPRQPAARSSSRFRRRWRRPWRSTPSACRERLFGSRRRRRAIALARRAAAPEPLGRRRPGLPRRRHDGSADRPSLAQIRSLEGRSRAPPPCSTSSRRSRSARSPASSAWMRSSKASVARAGDRVRITARADPGAERQLTSGPRASSGSSATCCRCRARSPAAIAEQIEA